jgi:aminopeptidase N
LIIFAHFYKNSPIFILMRRIFISGICVFFGIILFNACTTTKNTKTSVESTKDFREELLDTMVFSPDDEQTDSIPKVYRPTATMRYDLLHTKLEIRLDWAKQQVLGKATLDLTPYFYPIKEISLDAVNFDIHAVKLMPEQKEMVYQYDGEKILINLGREYKKGEKIQIFIDYTANPEETTDKDGEAISSDKGLFFINPEGKIKNKPRQVWTQGETENNKKWFPTFDKPNERCSQELLITVEDMYTTLSNGKLISSTKNADGTRTDYWKQDLPHAPYLFMMAVGEFYEEKEMWNQLPVHYFVEKGFKKSAKKIFNHTPEMLTFFSDKLKYPYPWDKYAQVVVRDFVSGAMENTTAVVFGEFVQKTDRELIDNDNDYIVAHELMHHWFGNLVTCEEWTNLTLNEGFANYAEYLWFEHKYGKERADYHRLTEMNGYFSQAYSQGAHPLIHYYYGDKEDMFDAHSYNKGGLVLHMLRMYTGDEAFFASLNKYLKDNAFSAVEVDELRMAFEDTTGEDLSWFFNQWFLESGHPTFDVRYDYNNVLQLMTVEVAQTQDSIQFPSVFIMPLEIATYDVSGKATYHSFMMDQRNQTFVIEGLPVKPEVVVFDGHNSILGLINETRTAEENIALYKYSKNFGDKMMALSEIEDKSAIINDLLSEKFYFLRAVGAESITEDRFTEYVSKLQELVLFDAHSQVRASALQVLLTNSEEEILPLLKRVVESEQAYPVLGLALEALSFYDIEAAEKYAKRNIEDKSEYITNSLMTVFAATGKADYLPYFHEKLQDVTLYQLFDFFEKYTAYVEMLPSQNWEESVLVLSNMALDSGEDPYKKFFCVNALQKLRETAKGKEGEPFVILAENIKNKLKDIKNSETDPLLKMRYSEMNIE